MSKVINLISILAAIVLTLSVAATAASAQGREAGDVALGLGSGTVANGLSLEYQFEDYHALQANLGAWGGGGVDQRFDGAGGVAGSVDYLHLMAPIHQGDVLQLAWNLGGGVGVGVDDDPYDDDLGVAAAFVTGLEFNFVPVPVDVTLEYRPTVALVPGVGVDPIDFTGHVRVRL